MAGEKDTADEKDMAGEKDTLFWRESFVRWRVHHLPSVLAPKLDAEKQFSRQNVYV